MPISTLPRKERKNAVAQLRILIDRSNLKQVTVARDIGAEPPLISRWVRGQSLPSNKWTPLLLDYIAKHAPESPDPQPAPSVAPSSSLTKKIERARRAVALAASLLDELAAG
jgi:hypothetical protein